jgi:hypothetical protein
MSLNPIQSSLSLFIDLEKLEKYIQEYIWTVYSKRSHRSNLLTYGQSSKNKFYVFIDGSITDKKGAYWMSRVTPLPTDNNDIYVTWPKVVNNICCCKVETFAIAQELRNLLQKYYEIKKEIINV